MKILDLLESKESEKFQFKTEAGHKEAWKYLKRIGIGFDSHASEKWVKPYYEDDEKFDQEIDKRLKELQAEEK